jgi:hypothetical protein
VCVTDDDEVIDIHHSEGFDALLAEDVIEDGSRGLTDFTKD